MQHTVFLNIIKVITLLLDTAGTINLLRRTKRRRRQCDVT